MNNDENVAIQSTTTHIPNSSESDYISKGTDRNKKNKKKGKKNILYGRIVYF